LSEHVIWLDDAACHRAEVTGGKGSSLSRMRMAGMPVPPGFVVAASALRDTLAAAGLLGEVEGLATSYGRSDAGDEIAARIQDLVRSAPPLPTMEAEVTAAYESLGDGAFVAVRSSACAEDGAAASFAGQQETFLNVTGVGQVLRMIRECWASFFSERAMFYRNSKGSMTDLGMAVVVQRQLASDKSGVMFTTDPIRRRKDQMVIEAAYGLGEAVVSGMVTPDNYVIRRDGRLKKAVVGHQDRVVVRGADGGTVTIDLEESKAGSQVLGEGELSRLAVLGVTVEQAFGSPQDIEWAIEGDQLFVLQSRPITA
jgi:pyruvate,water dikinase